MVKMNLMVAALAVLLMTVTGLPSSNNVIPDWVNELKQLGLIDDGKVNYPFATWCSPGLGHVNSGEVAEFCQVLQKVAVTTHELESRIFCGHLSCPFRRYDAAKGLCQCRGLDPDKLYSHVNDSPSSKVCEAITPCYGPYKPYWNPLTDVCACSLDASPVPPIFFEPNHLKELYYGPSKDKVKAPSIDEQILYLEEAMELVQNAMEDTKVRMSEQLKLSVNKREAAMQQTSASDIVSLAPLPTYIPPPDTKITDELIQESLIIQPQEVATVGSVIPHFADGVITFLVQLDGPISQTLALNATDTLLCETIGTVPQPNIVLVPKTVKDGTAQTMLPDCLILAVNTYNPKFITYWIQRDDGSVFTVLSDNKIHVIDQLDTTQPAAVDIRVAPITKLTKRDTSYSLVALQRTQVLSVFCEDGCPFRNMKIIPGLTKGLCSCVFFEQKSSLAARGVQPVSPYTTVMSAEACNAIICINNGDKPALFNPFTKTCWCATPAYVENYEPADRRM